MSDYYDYVKKLMATILMVGMLVSAVRVDAQETIKVGVLQYVEHESLNATYEGFVDGLKEAGYTEGDNLTLDFLNAAADNANLQSMSEKLVNGNDYLFAIATPAAQALANVANDKPLFFSAITDPVAAGLVDSLEKPKKNITGTIDAAPLEEQIQLLKTAAPHAKKVGIIYNSGEANSLSEAKLAKELLEKAGYQVEEATVTSTNDIGQVLSALVSNVDAIFTVTDNTIASAMTLVGDIAIEAKLAIIGGSEDMVKENGLATYGLNYYSLGKQTAAMLVKHIEEETPLSEMSVEVAKENNLIVNEEVAKKLSIDVDKLSIE